MHSIECIFLLKRYDITMTIIISYSVTVRFTANNNIGVLNKKFTAPLFGISLVAVCNTTVNAKYMRPLFVALLVSKLVI